MSNPTGILFTEPQNKPLSAAGLPMPLCYRFFYVTGTTTFAPVYQDGLLTFPYSQSPTPITSDIAGRFPPIYLDPAIVYRVQLWTAANVKLEDVDPYVTVPRNLFIRTKPASTSRVTNVVTADPDLQIAIPGAGTYVYEALIEAQTAGASGNTPGLTLGIAFSGTLSSGFAVSNSIDGNANGSVANAGAVGTNANYGLTGANVLNFLQIRGVITCTTAGTLSVNWAQQTTNATPTVLNAGDSLLAQQIG